jgi:hypothetical protein
VKAPTFNAGGLDVGWMHYSERRTPAWYAGRGLDETHHHSIFIVKKGELVALAFSDPALRNTIVADIRKRRVKLFESLKLLTGKQINDGFVRAARVRTLNSILDWLAANFDLPAIREAPHIEFIHPASMAQIRYRGSAGNQAMPLDMGRDIVAVYNDANRTIYLPEGWSGVTPAEQSLLVHEMVHHLQNIGNLKYECPQAREKLAFAAQEQWLELFDHTLASEFELDPFTLLVRTSCLG